MKNKIKILISLIVLIAVSIAAFLIIQSIPAYVQKETVALQKVINNKLSALNGSSGGVGSEFEVNTSNFRQYGDGDGVYWRVMIDGRQLYCASKGAHLSGKGITREEVLALVSKYNGLTVDCGDITTPSVAESTSRPYYKLKSTRAATPYEAYILTWPIPDWNSWSAIKQEAIWDSPSLSNNKKAPKETGNGITASALSLQAAYYQKFAEEIKANGGINPKDTSNQSEITKNVNNNTKEYTIGPFSMTYVNGNYGMVYGGVSDMYVVGKKTGRIEIKSFIIDGKEVTPDYFKPLDKYYVDNTEQGYPEPGKKFYVKFVSSEEEGASNIHVDFKWLETQATLYYFEAHKYQAVYVKDTGYNIHCHGHPGTNSEGKSTTSYCSGCCHGCKITARYVELVVAYQDQLESEGTRKLNTASLDIPIPPNDETPENLQIKLAGTVWEDEISGKESVINGKKDDQEKGMPGVEVILHYADNGAEVTRTVTNKNGYYEFNALNAQKKYYVEFVYNGQTYQPTNYTDNLSGGYSNASEIETQRNDFNNNFAQIGSYPTNYKVRRKLYYEVGKYNSAYILKKSASETPYGIKEIYDYVVEQAIQTKSYSSAYNKALEKFGNNDETKKKLQFIEDCRISSYTGLDTNRKIYPIYDKFTEGYEDKTIGGITYKALYPQHLRIDFGVTKRTQADLALRKDVVNATIDINGKTHTYTYDTRKAADEQANTYANTLNGVANEDTTWDISVRLSDRYYSSNYSREIFKSDYDYKVEDYGDNYIDYGKKQSDELEIYVTYKLTVRNQAMTALAEIMEVVDYYDQDYTYVNDANHRSYIVIDGKEYDIKASSDSIYQDRDSGAAITNISGYNKLYITGTQGTKLNGGQTAYIYVTFRVNKDNNRCVLLDEDLLTGSTESYGVGKENIAEVNGFKTYYAKGTVIPNVGKVGESAKLLEGTVAGLLDIDSVPGNVNPTDVPKDGNIKYKNFEDDTDKAPDTRVRIYRNADRTITGFAWEDERNVFSNNDTTAIGNGIKDEKETSINGITVQLVELMDNGTEYVWKQFSSGQGTYDPIINRSGLVSTDNDDSIGKYIFKSFAPGNYIVRFIYGDNTKTILTNADNSVNNVLQEKGQNEKSYNGQDYKSTTYQTGITQNKVFTLAYFNSKYGKNENITTYNNVNTQNETGTYLYDITASDVDSRVSDAKDIESRRQTVNNYSSNNVTNHVTEVLASHEALPIYPNSKEEDVGYNKEELQNLVTELANQTKMVAETGAIDMELEYDRILTGDQIVDNQTSYVIQDVNLGLEERPKAQLAIEKNVTNVKLTLANGSTLFDSQGSSTNVLWQKNKSYEPVYTKGLLTQIRNNNSDRYGLIQLNMDEELMHGATIKITYEIKVTNIGETDYKDNSFYYTGKVSNYDSVVTTTANEVIDYIANNLQFTVANNSNWEVITADKLVGEGIVNTKLKNQLEKYNTIITTNNNSDIAKTPLVPTIFAEKMKKGTDSASDNLVLTQLITSENDTDDLTYRNIVEIVKTSNTVGRRNVYSVVGNQNPTKDPAQLDSAISEEVKILPPFGQTNEYYVTALIILASASVLAAGIIFIKRKTLRK